MISALIKPFAKSEWISPAASRATVPFLILHARDSKNEFEINHFPREIDFQPFSPVV